MVIIYCIHNSQHIWWQNKCLRFPYHWPKHSVIIQDICWSSRVWYLHLHDNYWNITHFWMWYLNNRHTNHASSSPVIVLHAPNCSQSFYTEGNAVCQRLIIVKIIVYLEKVSFKECGKQKEQIPVIMFKWFIGGI